MIPIDDLSIRTIYQLEISSRPHLRNQRQREILTPVVARAKRKVIDHFRAKEVARQNMEKSLNAEQVTKRI